MWNSATGSPGLQVYLDASSCVVHMVDLSGKVALVTGATSGIGEASARALAGMGAQVHLLARNEEKARRTAAAIQEATGNDQVDWLLCDLARLADVHEAAATFLACERPLHILLNNAGIVNLRRQVTTDGYEAMFQVNHLSHYLLTRRLLDRIQASVPARIVNVSSGAHAWVDGMRFEDLDFQEGYKAMRAYGHSKLANLLFTRELARRLEGTGVTVNAVHPGAVATGLGTQNGWLGKLIPWLLKPFFRSPEKGARTSIYACTSPELEGTTGGYLVDKELTEPAPQAQEDEAARRLWERSAKLVNLPP